MDIPPGMVAAKEALAQALAPFPGITAVDVGLREEGPELTDEIVIRVFVATGVQLPFDVNALIAATPFPVVVIRRDFPLLADSARYDPVRGGIEIAAVHRTYRGWVQAGRGTFGGLATDTLFPGPAVGVSCAHVIAEGAGTIQQGDEILQPGAPPTYGLPDYSRPIGRLYRWSEAADIAVFQLNPGITHQTTIEQVGPYQGMATVELGEEVFKRGRTTLLTWGRVSGVHRAVFGPGSVHGFEIYTYQNPQTIFCDRGDSGSLVVNRRYQVVGLLAMAGLAPTWGVSMPGYASGVAIEILPAAAAVGVSF